MILSCEYNPAAMHKDHLPLKVDPFRFADNGLSLSGDLLIKNMPRLCSSLASDEGLVTAEMTFGVDEQGIRYIKGQLTAQLMLQCQRCLESFPYDVTDKILLGIVETEEAADQLPERYDPLIVADHELFLNEMFEEELIVSLPIVPMHDRQNCTAKLPVEAHSAAGVEIEKESPFKVIESLRKERNQ